MGEGNREERGQGSYSLPVAVSPSAFQRVQELVRRHSGIRLAPGKEALVAARLYSRMRQLGLHSLDDYLDLLPGRPGELQRFLNALTTNQTSFFRHPEQFELLRRELPGLWRRARAEGRRELRLWSAACSTGEEPYSIAMVLARVSREVPGFQARLLASDVDTRVLARAREGVYPASALKAVPPLYRLRSFELVGSSRGERRYRVVDALRERIVFQRINLLGEPYRFSGPLDAIFCRNVLIYFDEAEKRRVLEKLAAVLAPGGLLFLGMSESMLGWGKGFQPLSANVHRKLPRGGA